MIMVVIKINLISVVVLVLIVVVMMVVIMEVMMVIVMRFISSNKRVDLDNIDACCGKNKVVLGDVYSGGGDCNDDSGADDACGVDANGGDDADCDDCENNVSCLDNLDRDNSDNKDEVMLMLMVVLTLILVMTLSVVMARTKLIVVKMQLLHDCNSNAADGPNDGDCCDTHYKLGAVIIVMVKVMVVLMDIKNDDHDD